MSYCPRCALPGGGNDRNGRYASNHECRVNHFSNQIPGYVEIDPERVAEAKRMDETCRGVIERMNAALEAADEHAAREAEAEELRQQRMRDAARKAMEERQKAMQLKQFNRNFGFKV